MSLKVSLLGQKFTKLLVLQETQNRATDGTINWLCLCDCGTIKEHNGTKLRLGRVKSCGCLLGNNRLELKGQKFGRLTALNSTTKNW